MEIILGGIGIFMAGALIGFGIATIYSSNQIITLWDEKKRLNRELIEALAENQNLQEKVNGFPTKTIEISDPAVGQNVKFGGF